MLFTPFLPLPPSPVTLITGYPITFYVLFLPPPFTNSTTRSSTCSADNLSVSRYRSAFARACRRRCCCSCQSASRPIQLPALAGGRIGGIQEDQHIRVRQALPHILDVGMFLGDVAGAVTQAGQPGDQGGFPGPAQVRPPRSRARSDWEVHPGVIAAQISAT